MLRLWLLVFWLFAACAHGQSLIKCIEPGGKVTYQQSACATGSQSSVNSTNAAPTTSSGMINCSSTLPSEQFAKCLEKELPRAQREWAKTDQQVNDALNPSQAQVNLKLIREGEKAADRGEVIPGQLSVDVRRAWGNPLDVRTSHTSSGIYDTWTYKREGKAVRVYLRNMTVSRIDY